MSSPILPPSAVGESRCDLNRHLSRHLSRLHFRLRRTHRSPSTSREILIHSADIDSEIADSTALQEMAAARAEAARSAAVRTAAYTAANTVARTAAPNEK